MITIRDTNESKTAIILDLHNEANGRLIVLRNKDALRLGILLIKKTIWNIIRL